MIRRLSIFVLAVLLASACGPAPTSLFGLPTAAPAASAPPGAVHRAEGGDKWYPADPVRLATTIKTLLGQARPEPIAGRLLGVIVPHAGYAYSGAVAAYAYRALMDAGCAGKTIAVIGDTHSGNGTGGVAVWAAGAFETPLGSMPVDAAVAGALAGAGGPMEAGQTAFQAEHPVENQLPFLQVACPGASIVPIVVREPSLDNARALAVALVAALGDRPALIVASTDLSHYHPYAEARTIDEIALQAITSLNAQAVADSPERYTALGIGGDPLTMCSQGAVMAALLAAKSIDGGVRATVLRYANSGDTPLGSRDQVVGYGAVALWAGDEAAAPPAAHTYTLPPLPAAPAEPIMLTANEREAMLRLARQTAEQYLTTETFPEFDTGDAALLQPVGAYVTYEKNGELRGCIGRLEGDRPLYQNVEYAAVAAALGDPRFPAVTAEELAGLSIEITLIHPMHEVAGPDEIEIGHHGILMRIPAEQQGALYLPQVPVEQGWDRQATLLNLCRKAGLPDDCWQRPDAVFSVFTGQSFGEDQ